MLDSIRLKNFKCFEDSGIIDLKPLTLFCGVNSSGKSTILDSLLMMKQTFESYNPYRNNVLNGRLVHLGTFENIIHNKKLEKEFTIELKLIIYPFPSFNRLIHTARGNRISASYMYHNLLRVINLGVDRSVIRNKNGKSYLKLIYGFKNSEESNIAPKISTLKLNVDSYAEGEHFKGSKIHINLLDKTKYSLKWENCKEMYSYAIEEYINRQGKKGNTFNCNFCNNRHRFSSKKGKRHFVKSFYKNGKAELNVLFDNMIPQGHPNIEDTFDNRIKSMPLRPFFILRGYLEFEFKNINYLGPLREEPSRRYIYEEEPIEIGKKGENAPFILNLEKNTKIDPFFIIKKNPNRWIKKTNYTLSKALNIWLKYLGISDKHKIKSTNEIVYLNLIPKNNERISCSLADVGFGVSQIFPILVEGLRSKKGQVLILEQPEIHLHPKMQMLLADFFVSMILSGKRLIIETHSDHIVNRLARRIVEDEEYDILSRINILFIDRPRKRVIIKPIDIDEESGITNWPNNFFVQSAEEKMKIVEAGLKKKLKKNN